MKNFKTLSIVDLKNISGGKGTSIWGAFGKLGTAAEIVKDAWNTAKKDYKRWE